MAFPTSRSRLAPPPPYYGAGSGVAILLGVGGGAFAAPVTYAAGTTCSQIAAGDFNADGITDLAVASKGNSSDVTILIGQGAGGVGDGTFGPPASIPVAGNPFSIGGGGLRQGRDHGISRRASTSGRLWCF